MIAQYILDVGRGKLSRKIKNRIAPRSRKELASKSKL
jgi:hypothetical protein